jgi:hypothetical protein
MGGRGREGEPIEWTGSVPLLKRVTEENPGHTLRNTEAERPRGCGSHWSPGRQEKPLARNCSARTANRHW